MTKKIKKAISLLLIACMAGVTGCSGGADEVSETSTPTSESKETSETTDKKDESKDTDKKDSEDKDEVAEEEPVVIRFGTGAISENDPYHKDPVTGEYTMSEISRQKAIAVLDKIREELNVDLQFVEIGNVAEVLLQSVLAGDPVCDVARIYTGGAGTVLSQNVLQPLDEWEDLLGDPKPPKVAGGHYFVHMDGNHKESLKPLMYNIDYIEEVEALKVDGETVYPTDLYKEGKWTWSVFQDYIKAIDVHYEGSQSPDRPEQRIEAFWASWVDVYQEAIHSAGSSIYGEDGLGVNSEETRAAIAFVQELVDEDVMYVTNQGFAGTEIVEARLAIERGESVFGIVEDWKTGRHTNVLAERGHSLGYVPFPRPDFMEADDPNYNTNRSPGDTYAIVRGIDEEIIPYAIEATVMYMEEHKRLDEELNGRNPHISFDVFHEEIGQDMVDIYFERADKATINELSSVIRLTGYSPLVGNSLYGLEGVPSYDIAIEANMGMYESQVQSLKDILDSETANDNISPVISQVDTKTMVYPMGTDPASVEWAKQFTAIDNIDGALDMATATITWDGVDFNKAGEYSGIKVSISDASENLKESTFKVIVYDEKNADAPTIVAKEEPRNLKVDEDVSKINWANDFVDSAVDADGINIKGNVVPDLSMLDTSTAGTYDVEIKVSDYVGNEASVTVKVTVENQQ